MQPILKLLRGFSNRLEKAEGTTKVFFVAIAIFSYVGSLILLVRDINPLANLDEFLVKALANLSIPFSIILLQELVELIISIPRSALRSTCQQFELVALVILRSFFREFSTLNEAVADGAFSAPVQLAIVKIISLALITVLIVVFTRLIRRAGVESRNAGQSDANLIRQCVVIGLCIATVIYLALYQHSFSIMTFIRVVFTGMIILDAIFFLWMMSRNHEFDSLMFDGILVVSLIFARFPLFAVNLLVYPMAVIGVLLATGGLYLFVRPIELRFLGYPQEDEVARLDMMIKNQPGELNIVKKESALFLRQFNVAHDIIEKIRLSCEELINNIILFAYDDEREHDISVGLALCKNRLTITISNEGKPFNPFRRKTPEDGEPEGLGVYLVHLLTNQVAYQRQTGKNVETLLIFLDKNTEDS